MNLLYNLTHLNSRTRTPHEFSKTRPFQNAQHYAHGILLRFAS